MLERTLARYASSPTELRAVPDVQRAARELGISFRSSPTAMALRDATGGQVVLIRRAIDAVRVEGILVFLEIKGDDAARAKLWCEELFLQHLVLHELAHLENGWGNEREQECDRWAVGRLDCHRPPV